MSEFEYTLYRAQTYHNGTSLMIGPGIRHEEKHEGPHSAEDKVAVVNELGRSGWELTAVCLVSEYLVEYWFRRPK